MTVNRTEQTKNGRAVAPVVTAANFESRKIYQSSQRPGYTSWVQFFSGPDGAWFLSFVEKLRTGKAPTMLPREYIWGMVLPVGYITRGNYHTEVVSMRSDDGCRTWKEISRTAHAEEYFTPIPVAWIGGESFLGSCYPYSVDPANKPNDTMFRSDDFGKTWKRLPALAPARFAVYPYRVRRLRDGALVWTVSLGHSWGKGTDSPNRLSANLDAVTKYQMGFYYSYDDARTWEGPVTIFAGSNATTETDFVELPDGDLLFINNFIFTNPGRQIVHRFGKRFVPGFLEKVRSVPVTLDPSGDGYKVAPPETVCLTEDGILIGATRPIPGGYFWSDDLGRTWQHLEGVPDKAISEVYQPWMNYLGNGVIACAGHFGADDPVDLEALSADAAITGLTRPDQYISLHVFELRVARHTADTRIDIERVFDESSNRFRNSYTLKLTSDSKPLADKEIEFWYVLCGQPGYSQAPDKPLDERMKIGGKTVRVMTDASGVARVDLSAEMDQVQAIHATYEFVARFNADRTDLDYKPAQTAQVEAYAVP